MFRSTFQSNYDHLDGSAEHAELQRPIFAGARGKNPGEKEKEKEICARV